MNVLETRIDLAAIAHNTTAIKQLVAPAKLMCVVKADGYNHGVEKVAPVMAEHGADEFGVATISEACQLRELGITQPILCWIWCPEENFENAILNDIALAVVSYEHALALVNQPHPVRTAIKIDTGLHRSGLDECDWIKTFELLASAAHVHVTGMFSHLAVADDPTDDYTDYQKYNFERGIALGRECGLELSNNHLANSAAMLTRPDTHYDMVRPGLSLYGLDPIAGRNELFPSASTPALSPALSWVSRVGVVKPIAAGESTSYGRSWRAPEAGFIAIIPAGYADGVPRLAQSTIEVTIGGRRYQQVGRICMDQFVISLGQNEHGVVAGDEAIIFGAGGMSADEWAARLNTINYETICLPKGRTQRVYEGDARG
ncbi:alanine racemase [Corynebacterium kutscheri]|uniref:Alanine racemase n=1 Tax=Corynebacterium kutscheri TaxID=35755 RepID=A0AB38VPQ3_9CORY|nr:alanine racemase [Corynebacterium kutscheri]VEH04835.1 alanine racemase [Corynebacterium kutscheri]VEH80503.1 alanine racemase [Corynebacterium kutscheri]